MTIPTIQPTFSRDDSKRFGVFVVGSGVHGYFDDPAAAATYKARMHEREPWGAVYVFTQGDGHYFENYTRWPS